MLLIQVKPTVDDWIKWATKKKISPAIRRYVRKHGFKPVTPRVWAHMDTTLKAQGHKRITDKDVKAFVRETRKHDRYMKFVNKFCRIDLDKLNRLLDTQIEELLKGVVWSKNT